MLSIYINMSSTTPQCQKFQNIVLGILLYNCSYWSAETVCFLPTRLLDTFCNNFWPFSLISRKGNVKMERVERVMVLCPAPSSIAVGYQSLAAFSCRGEISVWWNTHDQNLAKCTHSDGLSLDVSNSRVLKESTGALCSFHHSEKWNGEHCAY